MTKISLSFDHPVQNNKFAFIVKRISHLSLQSVVQLMNLGPQGVFFCCELYLNDHLEKDRALRTLIEQAKVHGIQLFIMEIGYKEDWADISDFENVRISETELLTLLNDAEGR